jgi:hypothetical protein
MEQQQMQGENILVLKKNYCSCLNTSREFKKLECHREWKTEGTGRKRRPTKRWSMSNYSPTEEDT